MLIQFSLHEDLALINKKYESFGFFSRREQYNGETTCFCDIKSRLPFKKYFHNQLIMMKLQSLMQKICLSLFEKIFKAPSCIFILDISYIQNDILISVLQFCRGMEDKELNEKHLKGQDKVIGSAQSGPSSLTHQFQLEFINFSKSLKGQSQSSQEKVLKRSTFLAANYVFGEFELLQTIFVEKIRNQITKIFENQGIRHFKGCIQGQVVDSLSKLAEDKGAELNAQDQSHCYILSDDGYLLRFDWKISSALSENTQTESSSHPLELNRMFGVFFGITTLDIDFLDNKEVNKIESALTSLVKGTAQSDLAALVQKFRSSRLKKSYLSSIGIFEIFKNQEDITYGIGIYHEKGSLITLSKYFKEKDTKIGRIFFKKEGIKDEFPSRFDLSQTALYDVYRMTGANRINDFRFVEIHLAHQHNKKSKTKLADYSAISRKRKDICFTQGLAVGIKQDSSVLQLSIFSFENSYLRFLKLPFEEALLFLYNKQSEVFYGFYQTIPDRQFGQSCFLPHESLEASRHESPQSQNESAVIEVQENMIGQMHVQQSVILDDKREQANTLVYPYNSIGLLVYDGYNGTATGTAQFLYDAKNKNSRFLITCAHNFYKLSSNGKYVTSYLSDLDQFKFRLGNSAIKWNAQDITIKMKDYPLAIKNVYMPQQYKDQIKNYSDSIKGKPYKLLSEQMSKYDIRNHQLYDIAIIELVDPVPCEGGFVILKEEKPFKEVDYLSIEVAGFPAAETPTITYGVMYVQAVYQQKPEWQPKCVEIVEFPATIKQGKTAIKKILKHKLSTIGGNSGSPVYESVGADNCYLMGIHTTGLPQYTPYSGHNLATYIYDEEIYSWLISIQGIESVIN